MQKYDRLTKDVLSLTSMWEELLLKPHSLEEEHRPLHCGDLITERLVVHTNLRVLLLSGVGQNVVQVSVGQVGDIQKGKGWLMPFGT